MTRNDDLGYPIIIGDSARAALRTFASERFSRTIVLYDTKVSALAHRLTARLKGNVGQIGFALGEPRKNLTTLSSVLERLAGAGTERETAIIGVGGGVALDLFGFAASVYMRGVPFVGVATTLLAMVDAAIGGKTGVNLRAGKNLAGTFSDPQAVFCELSALQTLPRAQLANGLAEIVKHALIEGGELFESVETLAPHPPARWPWETVVSDSLKVKSMFVSDDRLERGARETLNLGHTFAHAIEAASGYRIAHGAAVSIGLRAAGLLAMRTGRFSTAEHVRLITLLALLELPLHVTLAPQKILDAMQRDKKKRDQRLRFVLPRAIGDVETGVEVPMATVRAVAERITTLPGAREFR